MSKVHTVDDYLSRHDKWRHILDPLREVLTTSELKECVKWGAPVYALSKKNVVGIAAFKHHAALWFFDGVLLDDPDEVLVNAQKGTTRALRQWRFEAGDNVDPDAVRRYVDEAIANARAGKTVKPRDKKEVKLPDELKQAMNADEKLADAFARLTPGRQREYAEHIGSAKQEATRKRRLDKAKPLIFKGVGLHDKYRNC